MRSSLIVLPRGYCQPAHRRDPPVARPLRRIRRYPSGQRSIGSIAASCRKVGQFYSSALILIKTTHGNRASAGSLLAPFRSPVSLFSSPCQSRNGAGSSRASKRGGRLRGVHCVAICCIARGKWTSRPAVWRKPAPTRSPKPTTAASAERFQRAVGVEYFDAGAGPRVDVEERLMRYALLHARGHRMSPIRESRTAHDQV